MPNWFKNLFIIVLLLYIIAEKLQNNNVGYGLIIDFVALASMVYLSILEYIGSKKEA